MAELVGQRQQSVFTTPVDGPSNTAYAADVVANDNAVRGTYNGHDADPKIHLQSGTTGERPAFGNLGAKYWDRTTNRLYIDTGSAWVEAGYALAAHTHAATDIVAGNFNSGTYNFPGTLQVAGVNVPGAAGTSGKIAKFTAANVLGDSSVSDNGTVVTNATQFRCRLTNGAANGTGSRVITFGTEDLDVGGMHSTVTNSERITVPTGGDGGYVLAAVVNFDTTNPPSSVTFSLRKNGVAVGDPIPSMGPATGRATVTLFAVDNAVATDYWHIEVNSAGEIITVYTATFSAFKVW